MHIIHLRYLGAIDLVQFMLALKIRGPESEPKHPCKDASMLIAPMTGRQEQANS